MSLKSIWHSLRQPSGQSVLRTLIIIGASLFAFLILALPIIFNQSSSVLKTGDVASQDIQSPRSITFESKIMTERAKQEAVDAIPPVYSPSDPSIARQQIEKLRLALAFITTIRLDIYATPAQKLEDISLMADIKLSRNTIERIVELEDNRWESLQAESIDVLGEVMQNTIRETNIDDVRHGITSLVSFSWTPEQATIIAELVSGFVTPNSLYNVELTEANRRKAIDAVVPAKRTIITGEMIVQRGEIISDMALEALGQLGLTQTRDIRQEILGAAGIVAVMTAFVWQYFKRRRAAAPLTNIRNLGFVALMFVFFLLTARLTIPYRTILPYLFPIPAFGLILAILFNIELSMILAMVLGIVTAYGLPNALDLTFYYTLGSIFGILTVGRAQRIGAFIWAGLAIACAGGGVILAYRVPNIITDWLGIVTLLSASLLNGLASGSLTILLQFIPAQLLGLTTSLQLIEVSRPDHPLLQLLLRSAPGSYQHSLMVANLAEQAAEVISADPLLTRVGALYHDIGKAANPLFFIENQVPGKLNPHNDLDPAVSAATIIQHVPEGLELARKYRLPSRVQDFIPEHHGTLLTRYQYTIALELAGNDPRKINPKQFQYPGPKPRSCETALIMLADGVEARARAELPKTEKELYDLIKHVVDARVKEGQLDDTDLTLKDLRDIINSFAQTLRGIYHPRIAYPDVKTSPIFFRRPSAQAKPDQDQASSKPSASDAVLPSSQTEK